MTKSNYFFSADWHVGHHNVIKYSNRPFSNVDDMNHALITNYNSMVSDNDYFIHAGDFTLVAQAAYANDIIRQLNGQKLFLIGSHDYWMHGKGLQMWEGNIEGQYVVANHYPMYSWPRSHYGSLLLHGHHHGTFDAPCKALDIGVDTNNFFPYSFDKIIDLMKLKPNTPGTIKK